MSSMKVPIVWGLALQEAFREHVEIIRQNFPYVVVQEVKLVEHLENIDALIIPGK